MKTYIALLRAINVGGYRTIKMADLRTMFESLGFKNIKTYIQSGNVVFDAPAKRAGELSAIISQQIEDSFGHDVPVLIWEPDEMKNLLKSFPFEEKEGWKGYIGFLSERPDAASIKELESKSSDIEKFEVAGDNLFVFVDKKTDQKPSFSNGFVEKILNLNATTRNLRTVRKILGLTHQ